MPRHEIAAPQLLLWCANYGVAEAAPHSNRSKEMCRDSAHAAMADRLLRTLE
jgi:hypothetical protein